MYHDLHWWWQRFGREAAAAAGACWAAGGCAEDIGAVGSSGVARFLRARLGLDEAQARELVRILDELATERAQARVDRRRMAGALADVLTEEPFDASCADAAAALGLQAAERMRVATVRALDRLHRVLRPEQRATLAMLMRSGALRFA
jgi:Spy/CpxP family protein refolding chaperone